ncbi:MAG: Loader and inhibitor of phage G40P [Firmicutes bacterium ADurb.Bin506]|nr:MAG: Loader and inhibitor of phage G40P [Firmicutes bacterium ADurb.Bin506]
MTREETIKLIGIITMAYPNFDKFRDEKHIRSMVGVWADIFSEDDSGIVALAVKHHISTSKWPPSIAEIRELMARISNPNIIPPDEAWEAVQKLMYAHPERLYHSTDNYLPKPIAEAVDAVGYSTLWALHCAASRGYSNKAGLDRVAFLQAYEAKTERIRQRAMLPSSLRQQIDQIGAAQSDGTREMLESVNRSYIEKQQQYEGLWSRDFLKAIDAPDETELLEERQMRALEAGKEDMYDDE